LSDHSFTSITFNFLISEFLLFRLKSYNCYQCEPQFCGVLRLVKKVICGKNITEPDERNVCVLVFPAALDVLDDGDDVTAREKIDQPVEQHLLDFQLSQNFKRLVPGFEQVDEELEETLKIFFLCFFFNFKAEII
jgi:hypothetical protein